MWLVFILKKDELQGGVSLSAIFSSDQLNILVLVKVFLFFFFEGAHYNNKWHLTFKSLQALQWGAILVLNWGKYFHQSSRTAWRQRMDSWNTWVGVADRVGQVAADIQAERLLLLLLAVHRVPSVLGQGVEIKQMTCGDSQKVSEEEEPEEEPEEAPCQSRISWMTDLWRGCWPCSCRAGWH